MGAYICNTLGTTVDEIAAINFALSPPLGFAGAPGFRTFATVRQLSNPQSLAAPGDAAVETLSALATTAKGSGNQFFADADLPCPPCPMTVQAIPSVLLVTYPAAGQIATFDIMSSALFGTFPAAGTALYAYYDQ